MVRLSLALVTLFVFAFLLTQGALGQTTTPTNSPTPTTTVPSGAPATGFGE